MNTYQFLEILLRIILVSIVIYVIYCIYCNIMLIIFKKKLMSTFDKINHALDKNTYILNITFDEDE